MFIKRVCFNQKAYIKKKMNDIVENRIIDKMASSDLSPLVFYTIRCPYLTLTHSFLVTNIRFQPRYLNLPFIFILNHILLSTLFLHSTVAWPASGYPTPEIFSLMLHHRVIHPVYTWDDVHVSDIGYLKWKKYLGIVKICWCVETWAESVYLEHAR